MMCVLHLILLIFVVSFVATQRPPEAVRYEWHYMNFTWPSMEAHNQAIADGSYIPKNNAVAGVKVWKDKFYLAIPRFRPGIPVTLASTSYQPVDGNTSPNLDPYPNWEMQKIGDCNAFQFVQSMEIDPEGRMWVIDTGRINILEKSKSLCPPRLVVFDLENDNKVLLNYAFPKEVADPESVYLNNLVLDQEDGGFAYITNADHDNPSIIVFSVENMTSWQVSDKSMKATEVNFPIKGDDTEMTTSLNIDGIALSPAFYKSSRIVYFAPMSSRHIFAIATKYLKNNNGKVSEHIKDVSYSHRWHTDGMIINSCGELFTGELERDTVARYYVFPESVFGPFMLTNYKAVFKDNERMRWLDNFAIDEGGNFWVTSNTMEKEAANVVNVDEINYRVLKLASTNYKNYQYYKDGTAPKLPDLQS